MTESKRQPPIASVSVGKRRRRRREGDVRAFQPYAPVESETRELGSVSAPGGTSHSERDVPVIELFGGRSAAHRDTRKFLRGAGLLLSGRLISILLNLTVQVLTVRYLLKSDYGAFAYALGIVSVSSSLVLMGLGKALPRFMPIYQERGDYARVFGAISLAVGMVWGLGLSLIALVYGLRDVISATVITDPKSLSLLLILIALCPVSAFDTLLQHMVAVFASPRAIFFRRYVLGPGLKLSVLLLVILLSGNVTLLAYGYLCAGLVGVSVYVTILVRAWRRQGVLQHLRRGKLKLPVRELYGFSFPLLSAELAVLRGSFVLIMLQHFFRDTAAVAEYRAVLSLAGLNEIVFEAFAFLYVPLASRLFARGQTEAIGELYWRTSTWIAVLTFPVFAVTCALATPITVLFFGAQYESAGVLLTVLALGYYFTAAIGFNGATLRVHGKVPYLVASDLAAAAVLVALSLWLMPRYGALGAAISMLSTQVVHKVVQHIGLWLKDTGIRLFDWGFLGVYLLTSLLMVALMGMQRLIAPPLYVSLALAAFLSLVVLRLTRQLLKVEETFPELLRLRPMRWLLT